MRLRATIRGVRKDNKFAKRGYLYSYYLRITDDAGNLWATDNTGSWQVMYDQALETIQLIDRAYRIGVLREGGRNW